jgi:hypothetical protein
MKIKEGKKYVDRRGRVFGPMLLTYTSTRYRFFGEVPTEYGWYESGLRSNDEEAPCDLIAEHVEICPMCDNPCVPGGVACKECGKFAVEYAGCPKESPDDWVTQVRVVVRPGVDEFRYPSIEYLKDWRLAKVQDNWEKDCMHAWYNESGNQLEVRCRRKDLPASAAPPLPKRTPVTLWVPERGLQEGGDWPVRVSFTGEKPTGIGSWVKVGVGPDGFFVEGGV